MNQPDVQETTFSLASMYTQLKAFKKKKNYLLFFSVVFFQKVTNCFNSVSFLVQIPSLQEA